MNVAIVIIDTLRYDHIAANGNADLHTPNLDRLVERSWNFHRAFAASFPTIPHRTDVITGRYGAPFHPWQCLACDVLTIPRLLAEHGYCSQLIHDTPHLVNGGHGFDVPFDAWTPIRGAEVDRPWLSDSWQAPSNWRFDPLFEGIGLDMEQAIRGHHALTCYVQANREREREEDWNVARLFQTSSKFLRDNTSRDNFFLWIDCFDPHEPWDAPPEFIKLYDDTPGYDGTIDPRVFHIHRYPDLVTDAVRERLRAMYRAKVTFMDKWFGVFLDTLDDTGLSANTAVILTADHGTNLGDRDGRFGKAAPPRENESHVPFVVYAPGAGSGDCDTIVQPQDIFATAVALAGVDGRLPEGVDAHNVLDIACHGCDGPRTLALAGTAVGGWEHVGPWDEIGPDRVLFSAFDKNWRLGFAANPEKCELQRLGCLEDVSAENQDVVATLRAAAIEEMQCRGLDPALASWLNSGGSYDVPKSFRATDASPPAKGWRHPYWRNMDNALMLKP